MGASTSHNRENVGIHELLTRNSCLAHYAEETTRRNDLVPTGLRETERKEKERKKEGKEGRKEERKKERKKAGR
jgi:hypothetical protein